MVEQSKKTMDRIGKVKTAGVGAYLDKIFIVILALYPLRHIYVGGDLWDTGYNYANFQYMGMEHMDSMWLFSTYLANVVGNLLSGLPGADSLLGMNLYTGLFVSALALVGYFFCTRKLKAPSWIVFLGEMLAVSLCWCPTAVLYNYLTYLLFLVSAILLYLGLTNDNQYWLLGAGALLGANVLVRFSNLPEMAMILAVWAYDLILWLEDRKKPGQAGEQSGAALRRRLLRHTLWCLLGYVAALLVLYLYIQLRYGLDAYIEGIGRLFAMTDNATGYKPTSMIMGLVGAYVENLYWFIRLAAIALGGVAAFALGKLSLRLSKRGRAIWTIAGVVITIVIYLCRRLTGLHFLFELDGLFLLLMVLCVAFGWTKTFCKVLWGIASALVIGWLYYRQFCSWYFYSYDSMLRPAILFMMLGMMIAVIRIFHRDSSREEKLISGMLILIALLTSLGSNNGVLPSINNLFLMAPYILWQSWRFIKCSRPGTARGRFGEWTERLLYPVKTVLIAFLVLCFLQFGAFGGTFVFVEATGVQNAVSQVENNKVLKNVKLTSDKASWLTEITDYVNGENLQGQEVILFGNIPALSYYLQMPSAFNPWSDLASYSHEVMEKELQGLRGRPVIILENVYALYEEEVSAGEAAMVSEEKQSEADTNVKLQMLLEYMGKQGYEQVFRNEKFAVYR